MGWTRDDSDALFRQAPDAQADEDHAPAIDAGEEAQRRRRFPFEVDRPENADEQPESSGDDAGHRD